MTIDGGEGGTGAAPLVFSDHVSRFFCAFGVSSPHLRQPLSEQQLIETMLVGDRDRLIGDLAIQPGETARTVMARMLRQVLTETYRADFARYADTDLLATMPEPHIGDTDKLRTAAQRLNVRTAADDDWDAIFFRILTEKIEPHLGHGRPTFLADYPVSQAALARAKPEEPRLAERFELYACGLELANAFGELTDVTEQRRRFAADIAAKATLYGEHLPMDEEFLDALAFGMPPAAGIALGFDRLVMLCAGADVIDDVLWAPVVGTVD